MKGSGAYVWRAEGYKSFVDRLSLGMASQGC